MGKAGGPSGEPLAWGGGWIYSKRTRVKAAGSWTTQLPEWKPWDCTGEPWGLTLGLWNKQPQFSGAKSAMALHRHSLKGQVQQALKAPQGMSPVPSPWELPEKAGKSQVASGRGRSGSSESPGTGWRAEGDTGAFPLSTPEQGGPPRAPIHWLLGSRKTLTLQTAPFSSRHPPPIT